MKREVYAPKGATCQKCGSPLAFYKLDSGKWCPCNVDGGDHWDDCTENRNTGKYGIKVVQLKELFIGHTVGKNFKGPAYSGELPPWEI